MASQRDPQNLKNLTKSATWEPQTPFQSSLVRFCFRKGFKVVPKDLQNLKNYSFTIVKQLFSEIHSDLKIDKKSNQEKVQNFDPKWPPKGTLKISKI